MLRPKRAEVQIYRRSARPAVHRERHRPRPLRIVERIGGIHHLAGRLVVAVLQRNRADRRRVMQRLSVYGNGLFNRLVGGQRVLHRRRIGRLRSPGARSTRGRALWSVTAATLALRGRGYGEHRKSEETESEGKSACIHTQY